MASESKSGRVARQAPSAPARKHRRGGGLLSLDPESSSRFLLIGVVALVLIVAGGFIAYGYWDSVVKPRNRTVLEVDGVSVSFSEMKRRMRYEYSLSSGTYQQAPQLLPDVTYELIVSEITVLNRAESELGIVVDESEFDQRLRLRIGATTDADQRSFADAMRRELRRTGLREDELRNLVRADLLRSRIRDNFEADIPATLEQAKLEVISVVGEDNAQQVIARIQAGEDWGTVAREVSLEPDADTTGGLVDFRPRVLHNAAYRDFAFNAAPGELSPLLAGGPTIEGESYFIVRVAERSEQPLADNRKSSYLSALYEEWLADVQSRVVVRDEFDQVSRIEALNDVIRNPLPSAIQPSVPQQQLPPGLEQQLPPELQQPPADVPPADAPPADGSDGEGSGEPAVPEGPVAPGPSDGQ